MLKIGKKHGGQYRKSSRVGFRSQVTTVLIGAAMMAISDGALAQDNEPIAADEPPSNAVQTPTEEELANAPLSGQYSSKVLDSWRAFLAEKGLSEGPNPGNKFIASGSATVDFARGAPGWIEARVVAFEIARLRAKSAMAQYLRSTGGSSAVIERIETQTWSDGLIAEADKLRQMERILLKVGDFTEATIDAALESLDPTYDTNQYDSYDFDEKVELAREIFEQSVSRAASSLVSGTVAYKVVEGPSASGAAHEVLVGIIWTPNLGALAAQIQNESYGISDPAIGESVMRRLPTSHGEAVTSLGVKVLLNENRERALLAFGQAEPRVSGPEGQDRAMDDAVLAAEARADAEIFGFVGEAVAINSKLTTNSLAVAYSGLEDAQEIGRDAVDRIRAQTPKVRLSGLTTLGKWEVVHPATGQKFALVARYWSPGSASVANEMRRAISEQQRVKRPKPDQTASPEDEKLEAKPLPVPEVIYEGTTVDDEAL